MKEKRRFLIKAILFPLCFLFTVSCSNQQKLLLGGSGWNKIVILDKATKQVEWEYPLEKGWECNSVDVDANGNILFSYSKGARLIDRNKNEIWDIKAPEGCELQTAKVLPDGNYLLAWCGSPAMIIEVDKTGKIIKQTAFDTKIRNAHSQFRQVSKNENGNYMVPLFRTADVREVNQAGEEIKSVKVNGGAFSVIRLPNKNYLVACGDAKCIVELNFETGEIVREIKANDIEGISLNFVAQLYITKKGGLYICNWQGHSKNAAESKNPQLVELDKNEKIIWELNDNERFGMISTIRPIK